MHRGKVGLRAGLFHHGPQQILALTLGAQIRLNLTNDRFAALSKAQAPAVLDRANAIFAPSDDYVFILIGAIQRQSSALP